MAAKWFKKIRSKRTELKFLFLGNSISYWHQSYDRFAKIASCNFSQNIEAECYCFPGISIEDITKYDLDSTSGVTIRNQVINSESPKLFQKYMSQKWNAVFLQDRDIEKNDQRKFAFKKIESGIGDSQMFLFQNYSNILFDKDLNQEDVNNWTKHNSNYSEQFSMDIVPIGNFFNFSFFKTKKRLFDEEGHPNKLGADAIALLYFYSVFSKLPKKSCLEKLKFDSSLIIDLQFFYEKQN